MPTPIPLAECLSLIDLMLTGDEQSFDINGVRCSVENFEGHACFEAATADFGLMMIIPHWYAGEHGSPAYIIIVGDYPACLQWLPIDRNDKCALIERLPLSIVDETLCKLAI